MSILLQGVIAYPVTRFAANGGVDLNAALPLALYDAIRAGDLVRARAVFHAQLPLLQFIVNGGVPA